jgi:hypothetical protein
MAIPIYDCDRFPPIIYPMTNTHVAPIKCLGNRVIAQEQTVTANVLARNNEEMQALYLFWRDECRYGLDNFYISLPIFGQEMVSTNMVLAKFIGDFQAETQGGFWTQSIKIEIIEPFKEVTYDL